MISDAMRNISISSQHKKTKKKKKKKTHFPDAQRARQQLPCVMENDSE